MKNIINKLANLIDVKSIMTLMLTYTFCKLCDSGEITAEHFIAIFTMIVGFFFGVKMEKHKNDNE